MFVHIRICAAFCCSEEKREEAEGGNSNGKLYKDWVVSGSGWDNAGSVTIDSRDGVDNGSVGDGLVNALLGGVGVGGIDISHNVGAAEEGVELGASSLVNNTADTSGILVDSGVGHLSGGNSNNECEGDEDGGGFHIVILFAVN